MKYIEWCLAQKQKSIEVIDIALGSLSLSVCPSVCLSIHHLSLSIITTTTTTISIIIINLFILKQFQQYWFYRRKVNINRTKDFSHVQGNHEESPNPYESCTFFGSAWPIRSFVLQSHVVGAVSCLQSQHVGYAGVSR